MSRVGLRRLGGVLGSAVLLALGCGRVIVGSYGSTGSTSTEDGGSTGGSSSASSDGSGASTATSSTGTATSSPPCGVVQLADVANGIGGFAMDGEAEWDWSGISVSGAGDVNGDGLADVIVGAHYSDPNGSESGRSYVVFGRAEPESIALADVAQGTGGFALDGEAERDRSGFSVSGAGDVNGDGLADVIVGAKYAEANGISGGRAYVVFGNEDAASMALADVAQGIGGFAMDGEAYGNFSGWSVSKAGDVNGDGLSDVIVGAPRADPNGIRSGRTYVVFGQASTDNVLLGDVTQGVGGFAMDGEGYDNFSGDSVSGAGDVNGDGLADVVVGAPHAEANAAESGRSYVVFGKTDGDRVPLADVADGTGGFAMDGEGWSDFSGVSVSGAGDINGDGLADVVVGAPEADPNGVGYAGRTYVVFGKADTDKVQLADVTEGIGGFAMDGEAGRDISGSRVGGAGDMNGDGLADVIVGAAWADPNGTYSGRTYVVFGKTDTGRVSLANVARGIGGFALDGEVAGDNSGDSLGGAGDTNGDGIPDLIVGAPMASPTGPASGRTYVVFGGDFSCEGR